MAIKKKPTKAKSETPRKMDEVKMIKHLSREFDHNKEARGRIVVSTILIEQMTDHILKQFFIEVIGNNEKALDFKKAILSQLEFSEKIEAIRRLDLFEKYQKKIGQRKGEKTLHTKTKTVMEIRNIAAHADFVPQVDGPMLITHQNKDLKKIKTVRELEEQFNELSKEVQSGLVGIIFIVQNLKNF